MTIINDDEQMVEKGHKADQQVEEALRENLERFADRPLRINGLTMIALERAKHFEQGYDEEHDAHEVKGELAVAAGLYALDTTYADEVINEYMTKDGQRQLWPWNDGSCPDKRGDIERIRQLAIAGSLIAAEIDRLQNERATGNISDSAKSE